MRVSSSLKCSKFRPPFHSSVVNEHFLFSIDLFNWNVTYWRLRLINYLIYFLSSSMSRPLLVEISQQVNNLFYNVLEKLLQLKMTSNGYLCYISIIQIITLRFCWFILLSMCNELGYFKPTLSFISTLAKLCVLNNFTTN